MKAFIVALALVLFPACAAAQAAPEPRQAFAELRSLVGAWLGRTDDGRVVRVSYDLIANDTVLVERWIMSANRTSMTVYHMDGENLIATHYCPQGNQPRLQYAPDGSGDRLNFVFRDATNLPDPNRAHQHAFWVRIDTNGTFARNETYVENGEAGSETTTFRRMPLPRAILQ